MQDGHRDQHELCSVRIALRFGPALLPLYERMGVSIESTEMHLAGGKQLLMSDKEHHCEKAMRHPCTAGAIAMRSAEVVYLVMHRHGGWP